MFELFNSFFRKLFKRERSLEIGFHIDADWENVPDNYTVGVTSPALQEEFRDKQRWYYILSEFSDGTFDYTAKKSEAKVYATYATALADAKKAMAAEEDYQGFAEEFNF